eukprot:m.453628 g.453628  ORF g.453628 m.453628 type:complete len:513 (+) comp21552_c0_seq2:152-1690(+)
MRFPSRLLCLGILLVTTANGSSEACSTDDDCSLNGLCTAGQCQCAEPWGGPDCQILQRGKPPSKAFAGVYGYSPNVSSWGGNVVTDPVTGHHHLFVTEIAGGCGLSSWGSHSRIAHAVSTSNVSGPYTRAGVAVPHQSHNPQALQYSPTQWLIFHIFPGSNSSIGPCPTPAPPSPPPAALCSKLNPVPGFDCHPGECGGDTPGPAPNCGHYLAWVTLNCTFNDPTCSRAAAAACAAHPECVSFSVSTAQDGKTQLFSAGNASLRHNPAWSTYVRTGAPFAHTEDALHNHMGISVWGFTARDTVGASGGSSIHTATSPDGPFSPLQTDYPSCNNPSPWKMKNGTLVVACTWRIITAPKPEGPWTELAPITISPTTRKGVSAAWEDPFLWQDERGHWHILSHTYTREGAGPLNSISGHLFSRDLIHWSVAPLEPYGNVVQYADGTNQTFSTMERPKLYFNTEGVPTHLTNGVSPVYPCDTCIVGDSPPGGGCCWCKVTPGEDYTYTLMQPLGGS